MLPTLGGRIQTRIVAARRGRRHRDRSSSARCCRSPAPLSDRCTGIRFLILAAVAVLGIGWECVYHFLMQWRWEKDWPTLFGLLTAIPEGVLVWLLLQAGRYPGSAEPFRSWRSVIDFWPGVAGSLAGGQRPDARSVHPVALSRREAGMNEHVAGHAAGLFPVPGEGVLARHGDLILLCSLEDSQAADDLLDLLEQVAGQGGDGRRFAGAVADVARGRSSRGRPRCWHSARLARASPSR